MRDIVGAVCVSPEDGQCAFGAACISTFGLFAPLLSSLHVYRVQGVLVVDVKSATSLRVADVSRRRPNPSMR